MHWLLYLVIIAGNLLMYLYADVHAGLFGAGMGVGFAVADLINYALDWMPPQKRDE
jgi:hypothetical protein